MIAQRKKILFISPAPYLPINAGNRARIDSLVGTLQRDGHDVHFALIPLEDGDNAAMAAALPVGHFHLLKSRSVRSMQGLSNRLRRKVAGWLGHESAYLYELDAWFDDQLLPQLSKLQAEHQFDAVIVEYVFMSKAFEAFDNGCLRILDTHDCFGLRHRAYIAAGMRPQWYSTSMQDEERGFRRADVVLAIQAQEASVFRSRLGALTSPDVRVVGHLIDIPEVGEIGAAPTAAMVGSSNPINTEGARWFMEKVMPLVVARHPTFQFLTVGAVGNSLPAKPGFVPLGYVTNVSDAMRTAMMVVNPVQMGTGITIKLLDALAAGMPIVTTRAGARGLDDLAGDAFLMTEEGDAIAFAEATLKVIENAVLRRSLNHRARQVAQEWNDRQISTLRSLFTTSD